MASFTIPTGPRTMVQQGVSQSTTLLPSHIFQTEAKNMYPKLALLEALASFTDHHKEREFSGDYVCETRRDFLDAFAYLCDVEKGGPTVTATALQELVYSNILWLASNEGIRREVKTYADSMLKILKTAENGNRIQVQDEILRLAVHNCSYQIQYYKGLMQNYAKYCRIKLKQEVGDDSVKPLRKKLKKLSEPPFSTTILDLVNTCHDMRGPELEDIRRRSEGDDNDFRKLAHYIGRLGATRSSADTVVRAMLTVPSLRQISDIRTVDAPESRDVTIDGGNISPYEIVRAICTNSKSQNPIQVQSAIQAIVDLDSPINDTSRVRATLSSREKITTRVHAELQMADRFSRSRNMEFLGDDKYIGCSKPACYFCYNWLRNHKHNYISPATHNKVILGCRGPDSDINEAGAVVLKEMYSKMCGNLDQHILDFLLSSENRNANQNHQYMSTGGSSRAPSRISTVAIGINTR